MVARNLNEYSSRLRRPFGVNRGGLTSGRNAADASRLAGQIPNECLICLSIDMVASVYRPWVRYWSSCDAPSSIKAAITKPLNIVGLSKETANRAAKSCGDGVEAESLNTRSA